MFNHNFIHKFQPRANGARAVVEAVDMDAFASALRGSFARGGRGGRGASTRFRSTRSDDCWRILLIFLEPLRVSRDWSGAERSKTKRGCVNAGLLQSIGAVRARGEFDTEVASTVRARGGEIISISARSRLFAISLAWRSVCSASAACAFVRRRMS